MTSPGPVVPKASLRLHTIIAYQLFFGRNDAQRKRDYHDPCFATYAANLSTLWRLAQDGDPYADAALLRIEAQMEEVRAKVKKLIAWLEDLLISLGEVGIQFDSQESLRPVDVPISFKTTHAAASIQILGLVDQAIQKALAARHFGLVMDEDWQQVLARSVKPMRTLFTLANFRASGTKRDDFAANNARAQAAIEKFGVLPEDVLTGELRPKMGPRLAARSKSAQLDPDLQV